MDTHPQRKRCLNCSQWFTPDPRTRERQQFCAKPACKKASKAWRQAKWLAKPENADTWCGEANVARVREWRKEHPGYWRRERRRRVRYKTT